MKYDFNVLEQKAQALIDRGRPQDAVRIYLFMADGDPSLDGGYLGQRIAECYERMGDFASAKYWYGRAVQENPDARGDSLQGLERLRGVAIDDLVPASAYTLR